MSITKEQLEQQLATSKNDVENSRIMMHRSEGIVLLLTHFLEVLAAAESSPPAEKVSKKSK